MLGAAQDEVLLRWPVEEVVNVLYDRVVCFFFFSSRRRHTRLQGDWSSDVCSSDLRHHAQRQSGPAAVPVPRTSLHLQFSGPAIELLNNLTSRFTIRSLCRLRW